MVVMAVGEDEEIDGSRGYSERIHVVGQDFRGLPHIEKTPDDLPPRLRCQQKGQAVFSEQGTVHLHGVLHNGQYFKGIEHGKTTSE
jgi:hypothetical protein